jgi:hypothetical protein
MSLLYETNDGKDRQLTCVSVPNYAKNRAYAWSDNGGCFPYYPKTSKCGFYLSTGTSNTVNFPDIWFPFLKIQEKPHRCHPIGWVYKTTGLHRSKRLAQELEKLGVEMEIVKDFLEKFSHWFQVQISAGLTEDFSIPESSSTRKNSLELLHKIALTYSFDKLRGLYRDPTIDQKIVPGDTTVITDDPYTINEWMLSQDALPDLPFLTK